MKKSLVLLIALSALALPAAATAAPNEGPGTVAIAPDPVLVPTTTVGNQGEWLAVDVSYAGEGEAAIDKISLLGEEAGEFSSNGSDCNTLQSGQHCTAWLALKPSTTGDKQATLEVRFQGERPAETRTVSGRSVAPQLTFSPASHDFGIQRVNREPTTVSLQLTNGGEAPVQPSSFEVEGDNNVFWTGSSSCWTMLAPGASCEVQVWFNPNDVRDFAAQLKAWANGSSFSAALSGRGGRAIVGAGENPVGFPATPVGQSVVRTVAIANSGDLPGLFFIAVIAGGDAGSFRLLSEGCTMVALLPGDACLVRVRFEPQEPGPASARFAMFGDSDDATMVLLQGVGEPAVQPGAPASSIAAGTAAIPDPGVKPRQRRFARNKSIHAPRGARSSHSKPHRQSRSSTRSGIRGSS